MNRFFNRIMLLVIGLLVSCAYNYKLIELNGISEKYPGEDHLNYSIVVRNDSLSIWEKAGNKELANQCSRKKLQFSVVEVSNYSDSTIYLSPNDIEVFSNLEMAEILLFDDYFRKIKQPSFLFLGYGLGTIRISSVGVLFATEPISSTILLLWAGFHVTKSILSNHKLKNQIEQIDIFNQPILPHSRSKGIICTQSPNPGEVFIRIIKK